METVYYIKSQNLQESFTKLGIVNKTLEEIRLKEKKEKQSEKIEYEYLIV